MLKNNQNDPRSTDVMFTPVDAETGRRLCLYISAEEAEMNVKVEPAIAMDQDTGRIYLLEQHDCGLDCKCDMLATELYPEDFEDEAAK